MDPKDIFKFVLDTRNFEITNFWQRSNYFLVLNTGLAIGFFNLKIDCDNFFRILISSLGVVVCLLWYRVALGSKFWQIHWENKLKCLENIYINDGIVDKTLGLFNQNIKDVKEEVRSALKNESHHGLIAKIINIDVVKKPSVTQAMITLSTVFIVSWFTIFLVSCLKAFSML